MLYGGPLTRGKKPMTEHQHTPSNEAVHRAMPPSAPAHPSAAESLTQSASRDRWHRRVGPVTAVAVFATAAAAFPLGMSVGAGISDPTESPQYRAIVRDRAAVLDELDDANATITDLNDQVTEVQGDLPAREDAVKHAESEVALREKQVTLAEEDVSRREKKVGIVERTIARNTLSGEGMYAVGSDMKPGTYKSAGHRDCYYAVLNSSDTNDIATNNIVSGPAFVTVHPGQYFETTRCADWVLQ